MPDPDFIALIDSELGAMRRIALELEPLSQQQRAAVLLSAILLHRVPGFTWIELVDLLRQARDGIA